MEWWIEWLGRRIKRHLKAIARIYKPEIKTVAVGMANGVIDDTRKEFVEHCKPPAFVMENVDQYLNYLKTHVDEIIDREIEKALKEEEEKKKEPGKEGNVE